MTCIGLGCAGGVVVHFNILDLAGLLGVAMILGAYAAAQLRGLDPLKAPALILNFVGASLVLVSLIRAFNLSAAIVEGAWALIALFGLIRLAFRRR
jgi:hypothetical protein